MKFPRFIRSLWEQFKYQGSVNDLNTFFMLMPVVRYHLKKKGRVDLLYFDIKNFTKVENEYGQEVCYQILSFFVEIMTKIKKRFIDEGYQIELAYGGGDDFIVLIFEPNCTEQQLENICIHIKDTILNEFAQTVYPSFELYHSYSIVRHNGNENLDHLIYRQLKSTSMKAKNDDYRLLVEKKKKMWGIMEHELIYPVYQPIISLQTGEHFASEALTRGERNLKMSPIELFDMARETGMLLRFERLARELAIRGGQNRNKGEKLFINLTPEVINEMNFRRGETHRFLQAFNFRPEDIVFEITESSAIKDFKLFRKVVEHYRAQGYKIAVDDAGSGFSTLQVIAELHPDFIKIDMSLVRDIDKTPIKAALVEAMIDFSRKMGVQLVAEGIETFGELERLLDMGIDLGQGYLIGRPGDLNQSLNQEVVHVIEQYHQNRKIEGKMYSYQLKELLEFNRAVSKTTLVKEVVEIFDDFPGLLGVVVIDEDSKPIGLVMKDHLYYKLGSAYGVALFMKRTIVHLMDHSPLVVDVQTELSEIAKLSMQRDSRKLYDFIIVTQNDIYVGTISVRSLLEKINHLQVELARDANPLTGLPGNHLIEKELTERLNLEDSFGVIYVDLDHFKQFNDYFGYGLGDEILTKVADWCTKASESFPIMGENFVGHIGGDDFILITDANLVNHVANRLIEIFQNGIEDFYQEKDISVTGIKVKDRNGELVDLGLSISLASGIYDQKRYANHHLISRELAILKGKSKEVTGNSHCRQEVCNQLDQACAGA